jgi:hypothetical protein
MIGYLILSSYTFGFGVAALGSQVVAPYPYPLALLATVVGLGGVVLTVARAS